MSSTPRPICVIAVLIAGLLLCPTDLLGQFRSGRSVPDEEYFSGFGFFYAGEYRTASRSFRSAARGGVKTPERRWVDAICYDTMMGECFYHQGDLNSALKNYDSAIAVFLANTNWLTRLKYPPQIQPKQARVLTWGPSSRKTLLGNFPETILSQQSSLNVAPLNNRETAIIPQKEYYRIRGIEIFRCMALALSRRYEILGPLTRYDPLSSRIERRLAQKTLPPNHWAQKLLDVQLGLAKLGAGYEDDALQLLNGAVSFGQLDHPLTSRALLEIGKIALQRDRLELAFRSFYEATFPAAQFNLIDQVEEGFVLANKVHRLSGVEQPFAALESASVWARAKRYDRLFASLLIVSAENAALKGNTKAAKGQLITARKAMGRSDLSRGDLGATFNYLTALVNYQSKKDAAAKSSLDLALNYQSRGSRQLFRIAKVHESAKNDVLSPRIANELFNRVLRVPSARDWRIDPMEAYTVQATPHLEELEYWLQIALDRNEINRVVNIGDRIRRKKFFATLPMRGRVLALRWVLHAPAALLDETTNLQRQNLLRKFPDYAESTNEANRLRAVLEKMDPIPEEGDPQTKWKDMALKLDRVSKLQEDKLKEIALHPEPASLMFPPLRTVDAIQAGLQPGQAVLDIITTRTQAHFIFISAGKDYEMWTIQRPARIRSSVIEMLRSFGNYSKDKPVSAANLANDSWKKVSKKLYETLFPQKNAQFWNNIGELIIVPDGFFWYLPFEGMYVDSSPLISLTKIRYVPLASLAVNDPRRQSSNPATVIVRGRLYNNRKMDTVVADAANAIAELSPQSKILTKLLPIKSSLIGHRWDRLVVLDDIENIEGEDYAWSPTQADGKGPGTQVEDWMKLPFGAPDQLILPGYHTAAESGGKSRTTGDELLKSTLAMMASGCRTVLISRWRTGGQTSLDVIREFLSQSPQGSAATSMQRSLQLIRSEAIDPDKEPRVKGISENHLPTGEHPFFWAGIQLLDLGQPKNEE